METALKNVPITEPSAPEGVVFAGGEWYFEEFSKERGVNSLGEGTSAQGEQGAVGATEDKKKILDLFRN